MYLYCFANTAIFGSSTCVYIEKTGMLDVMLIWWLLYVLLNNRPPYILIHLFSFELFNELCLLCTCTLNISSFVHFAKPMLPNKM